MVPLDTLCGFVVVDKAPQQHLVLRSTSHLPLSWRRRGIAGVDWTWAFVLVPTSGGTRLLFRWRAHTRPWWLTLGAHAFLLPADYVMSREHAAGHRLEGDRRPGVGPNGSTVEVLGLFGNECPERTLTA